MLKNKKELLEKYKTLSDPRLLGLIAFGIVALLVTWSALSVVQRNYELDKQISIQQQKNEIARLENENLKLSNLYYESDQYLELSARRQFGKASPGETLFIIPEEVALSKTVDRPADPKNAPDVEKEKSRQSENIESWIEFLFR